MTRDTRGAWFLNDPGRLPMSVQTNSDGSTQDLTSQVLWTSSQQTVALVSNAPSSRGVATAVQAIALNSFTVDSASGGAVVSGLRAVAAITAVTAGSLCSAGVAWGAPVAYSAS